MASKDPNNKYKYGDQQDWVARRNANDANLDAEVQSLLQQIENLNAQAESMSKKLKAAIDAFEAEGDHTDDEIKAFEKIVNKRRGLIQGRITSAEKLRQQIENEQALHGELAMNLEKEGDILRGEVSSNARKRRTVAKGLRSTFGSSKIAAAFMKQGYVQSDGAMTIAGEKKAERIREQNQFISRLVKSLGTLPFFNKAGRALQQLGVMTMMSGVSKFRQGGLGNQLQGMGLIGLGLAEYLAPAMASAFSTVMTTVVAKKIAEAVAIGTMKGNLGKIGGFIGKLALPLAVAGGIAFGVSDLSKKKKGYDTTPKGKALAQATSVAQGGLVATGILGAVGTVIAAAVGAPLAPIILATGVIAGVIYGIGKNLDRIAQFFTTLKDWLDKQFDKINPFKKDKKENPSYTKVPVGTNQIVQSVSGKKVDPRSVNTFSTDRFNIYQYGSSKGERGGATVMGSKYTQAQLEQMGREGRGGLETLKGLTLANTFTNDAKVARAGSSAILQAVQAKIGAPLTVTSAMASKTSGHAKGKLGHEGGQKFDFSAAGMNKQQALQYAQNLYATGYFSHAEAEYDKKTGQWHIDARISDQAYKTVENMQKQQQEQKQATLKKTSPRVKEAPGTAKVTDVINGSLGLRNSLYGPALGI